MRRTLTVLLGFFVLLGNSAYAKSPDMAFFDVFLEPQLSLGMGSYEMGKGDSQLDEGDFSQWAIGGKLGLKIGPIFLGFDYLEGEPRSESNKQVSSADRLRYPLMDSGKAISLGPIAGLQLGSRAILWASVYNESLEQEFRDPESYEHEFKGSGYRVALSFDIYNHITASLFYHARTYDKYNSSLSTDIADNAALDHEVTATTYGLMLSYFLPVSKIPKIANAYR